MGLNDGKTEKITGRRKKRQSGVGGEGLGDVSGASAINGIESIGASSQDSQGRNSTGSVVLQSGDDLIGKILERLDALEKRHLKYVDAHQERLKARLGESEQEKNGFLEEANQIRSDIYHLVARQSDDLAQTQ